MGEEIIVAKSSKMATAFDDANLLARLDRLPITWTIKIIIAVLMFVWLAEAFDIGTIGPIMLLIKKTWHLTKSDSGLLGAASTIGIVLALPPAGKIADRYGRRVILIFGLVVFSLFTLAGAVASNVHQLMIFRFIAGLGEGAVFTIPYLLLTELVNKKRRGVVTGWAQVLLGIAYALTSFAGFWVTGNFSPDSGWRIMCILGGVPLLLLPFIWKILPESPRYLLKYGRAEEVRKLVETLEDEAGVSHDTSIVDEKALQVLQATEHRQVGPRMLLRSPYLMRCFVSYAALAASFVGFYLVLVFGPVVLNRMGIEAKNTFLYLGAATLFSAFIAPVDGAIGDYLGRRATQLIWMLVSAVTLFLLGLEGLPILVLVVAGVLQRVTIASSFTGAKVYMAEQFPTRLRGLGVGVGECITRFLAGVVFVYFIPFLISGVGVSGVFKTGAALIIVLVLPLLFWGRKSAGINIEELGTDISSIHLMPAEVRNVGSP
jgi:putative MFS transporter